MTRKVSPVFAVVVILFALLVGALYFMTQYRKNEWMVAQEKAGLQARMKAAKASGRMDEHEDQMRSRQQSRAAAASKPDGAPKAPATGAKAPVSGKQAKPAGK